MSDPSPNDEQIELASAYVDDVLDGPDRARAEADPAVMDLVARFRGIRSVLAVPIVTAPDDVDRTIAAAMATFTPANDGSASPVVDLAARRRARSGRLLPWAAAAAAVAIVALGVSQLGGGSAKSSSDVSATAAMDGESEKAAASGTTAAAAGRAATTAAGATSVAGGAAAATAAPAAPAASTANRLPDLGAIADTPTLVERARAVTVPATTATRDTPTNDACSRPTAPVATLTYRERAAQLFVITDPEGRRTAVVIATPTCEVLAETLLP